MISKEILIHRLFSKDNLTYLNLILIRLPINKYS